MVLGRFGGGGKDDDVASLIAKKNYTRAIEVIRDQLAKQRNDPRLRLQLADVLVSAGKAREAVTILLPLADEFAKEHAPGAIHLSRGTIELKIEQHAPDMAAPIMCYCGGGGRSRAGNWSCPTRCRSRPAWGRRRRAARRPRPAPRSQ